MALAVGALAYWWFGGASRVEGVVPRTPVVYQRPTDGVGESAEDTGTLLPGPGVPSESRLGTWNQFRGEDRTNVASANGRVLLEWPDAGPPVLWRRQVGEGHAGAAVHGGRVYLEDYSRDDEKDALLCLSLDDGQEIWRFTYSVRIKRNHGMSRTVPAVAGGFVVMLGPKCHLFCLDAESGELLWKKQLVEEYGTEVPPWYAGQCPLIDGDRLILAPGADPLMTALDLKTGDVIWETPPDLDNMGMTHGSVLPIEFEGERQYVYCTRQGVVAVSAEDGSLLWSRPDWKIGIANIPTPVWLGEGRLLFTGGYDAGSLFVQLRKEGGRFLAEDVARWKASEFGSDQQTPIYYDGHVYAVAAKPLSELVCLDREGNRLWSSGKERRFGLGPYLICDGLILALNDQEGTLHLTPANPAGYQELAHAKILDGHDAWAPMAMADGYLLLRDLTELVCLDLRSEG